MTPEERERLWCSGDNRCGDTVLPLFAGMIVQALGPGVPYFQRNGYFRPAKSMLKNEQNMSCFDWTRVLVLMAIHITNLILMWELSDSLEGYVSDRVNFNANVYMDPISSYANIQLWGVGEYQVDKNMEHYRYNRFDTMCTGTDVNAWASEDNCRCSENAIQYDDDGATAYDAPEDAEVNKCSWKYEKNGNSPSLNDLLYNKGANLYQFSTIDGITNANTSPVRSYYSIRRGGLSVYQEIYPGTGNDLSGDYTIQISLTTWKDYCNSIDNPPSNYIPTITSIISCERAKICENVFENSYQIYSLYLFWFIASYYMLSFIHCWRIYPFKNQKDPDIYDQEILEKSLFFDFINIMKNVAVPVALYIVLNTMQINQKTCFDGLDSAVENAGAILDTNGFITNTDQVQSIGTYIDKWIVDDDTLNGNGQIFILLVIIIIFGCIESLYRISNYIFVPVPLDPTCIREGDIIQLKENYMELMWMVKNPKSVDYLLKIKSVEVAMVGIDNYCFKTEDSRSYSTIDKYIVEKINEKEIEYVEVEMVDRVDAL